jgi:outer membrane protein assembly factor BamB
MMKALKRGGIALTALAALFVILHYGFNLRVEMSGSFWPRLAFLPTAADQARTVEAHRAAQRMQAVDEPGSEPGRPTPANDTPPSTPGDPTLPVAAVATPEAYWTDFRGPLRDGVYREMPLLRAWPAGGLTPRWRQPIGGGYASFVVARGRAFTIEQRGDDEVVAAYDVTDGRELWTHRWTASFQEPMGGDGPRATPTWHDGRVYALGAEGELRCLDDERGGLIWRTNILEDAGAGNLAWGMSASPLIVGDTVITLPGGGDGRSVVAYDRRTGARRWSSQDDGQAYSSPMLVTLAGTRQLLVFAAARIMGLTPDDGDLLWSYPWQTQADINVAQPIVIGENRVFVSSGYGVGAAMLEIVAAGDGFTAKPIWQTNRMKNKFSSSVFHDGFIYGLDEGILACVDAATGELMWKGGRYGHGQLLLAGDRLIVSTEDGDLVLVATNPKRLEEIARSSAISGKTWNHPAIAGGRLFVRNSQEMAAFDLR